MTTAIDSKITAIDWHTLAYHEAWALQKQYFQNLLHEKATQQFVTKNYLFLCEHLPVFTLGKSAKMENLLVSETQLTAEDISLYRVERGGDITFHGLGQCVGYPILDLDNFAIGLRQYIFQVEEVIIRLLAMYDIKADRLVDSTGVWVAGKRKICALGVKSSRMITMHGFALNVNTDLHYFDYINPCGIRDKGVTSMAKELGKSIDMQALKINLIAIFQTVFNLADE